MKLTPDGWRLILSLVQILLLSFLLIYFLAYFPPAPVVLNVPVPVPAVPEKPCALFDGACDAPEHVEYVLKAMQVMAETENPKDLGKLTDAWGADPKTIAKAILTGAQAEKIDPLLLVAMAWIETRFNPKAESDWRNRPREGRNCGMLQVRTDLPGRPSCDTMKDINLNVAWAAAYLNKLKTLCQGKICLSQYNAGDYEDRVWRTLDWLRRQMWQKELP